MSTRTQRRAGGAKRTRQTRGKSREKAASTITMRRIDELRPYEGNARTHSKRQIRQIADSIDRFGFTNPVLIADDDTIIAGHGRVLAAKQLGMREVPTVRLSHMNEAERRAYILADNKLALNAGWDQELLAIELQALVLAGLVDHMLPQRFRRSEADELALLMEFKSEDRRKLAGRIEREAARLERERPPSTLSDAQRNLLERTMQRIRDQLWPDTEDG